MSIDATQSPPSGARHPHRWTPSHRRANFDADQPVRCFVEDEFGFGAAAQHARLARDAARAVKAREAADEKAKADAKVGTAQAILNNEVRPVLEQAKIAFEAHGIAAEIEDREASATARGFDGRDHAMTITCHATRKDGGLRRSGAMVVF